MQKEHHQISVRLADDPLLGIVEDAVASYRRSLGTRYAPAQAKYAAGRVYEMIDQPVDALESYLHALSEPDVQPWPALTSSIIRCAASTGLQETTARQLAERAVATPTVPELGMVASHLFRSVGFDSEAAEILRSCLEDIAEPEIRYVAARELLAVEATLGHTHDAIDLARELIATYPDHEAPLRANLSGLLASLGRLDESLAEAQRAVDCDSSLSVARFVLGASLLRLGRREEALVELDRAIQINAGFEAWVTELLERAG